MDANGAYTPHERCRVPENTLYLARPGTPLALPDERRLTMIEHACRACRSPVGDLVLDLGEQPACDYFPEAGEPGPDPVYPLQMWLCGRCGLAQLLIDPTAPEEPKGAELAALIAQAADAVGQVAVAGLLPAGALV